MYSHLNFREKMTLYLNKWQKLRCCWLLALAHDEIFGCITPTHGKFTQFLPSCLFQMCTWEMIHLVSCCCCCWLLSIWFWLRSMKAWRWSRNVSLHFTFIIYVSFMMAEVESNTCSMYTWNGKLLHRTTMTEAAQRRRKKVFRLLIDSFLYLFQFTRPFVHLFSCSIEYS